MPPIGIKYKKYFNISGWFNYFRLQAASHMHWEVRGSMWQMMQDSIFLHITHGHLAHEYKVGCAKIIIYLHNLHKFILLPFNKFKSRVGLYLLIMQQ